MAGAPGVNGGPMAVCLLGQRRPDSVGYLAGRTGRCLLWSCVRHGPISSDRRSRSGSSRSSTARRCVFGRGAGRLYERQGLDVETAPRGLVVQHPRQGRAAACSMRLAHACSPLPLATDARHRQRQRADDRGHDPAASTATRSRCPPALWHEIEEAAPELVGDRLPTGGRSMPGRIAAVVARRARERRQAARHAGLGASPSRSHNYICCGCGCPRAASIRIATCASPWCRRPHMVAYLSGGAIDGYCVGEPWNQQSAALGIGRIAATSRS